jgi:hypothetical protein
MSLFLDRETLRRAVAAGAVVQYRFFWGHQPREDGALSDGCFSQQYFESKWPGNRSEG